MKQKKEFLVPFYKNSGNMANMLDGVTTEADVIWKENYEFEDTMIVDRCSRGQSTVSFDLISKSTGIKYNTFMVDMFDLITKVNINKGVISGKWTFTKRGKSYGLKMIFEENEI